MPHSIGSFSKHTRRYALRFEVLFEPRDLWVGVYWDRPRLYPCGRGLDVYVGFVPTFPVRFRVLPRVIRCVFESAPAGSGRGDGLD
jgi:hypothetical protein